MERLCYALRPEGIEWPLNEDGSPSFRLELLTAANNLSHESAHDALSDVYATIALAKLIKDKKASLFDYALRLRAKKEVAQIIDLHSHKPLLHISSRYPATQGCAALVMPIAMHPINSNGVIVYDLSAGPELLTDLSVGEITQRVFTKRDDLDEGQERVPLKVIHLNRSPMVATPKLADAKVCERLQLDKSLCDLNWQSLQKLDLAAISKKVQAVFEHNPFGDSSDPEQALYQGFLNDRDKATLAEVRAASEKTLSSTTYSFYDKRLPELLFRYRARNFPNSLSKKEQAQWQEHRVQRLTQALDERILTLDQFNQRIEKLLKEHEGDDNKTKVLRELQNYGNSLLK